MLLDFSSELKIVLALCYSLAVHCLAAFKISIYSSSHARRLLRSTTTTRIARIKHVMWLRWYRQNIQCRNRRKLSLAWGPHFSSVWVHSSCIFLCSEYGIQRRPDGPYYSTTVHIMCCRSESSPAHRNKGISLTFSPFKYISNSRSDKNCNICLYLATNISAF